MKHFQWRSSTAYEPWNQIKSFIQPFLQQLTCKYCIYLCFVTWEASRSASHFLRSFTFLRSTSPLRYRSWFLTWIFWDCFRIWRVPSDSVNPSWWPNYSTFSSAWILCFWNPCLCTTFTFIQTITSILISNSLHQRSFSASVASLFMQGPTPLTPTQPA